MWWRRASACGLRRPLAPWRRGTARSSTAARTASRSAVASYELTLAGVTPVPALGDRLRAGDPLADAAAGRWAELGVRPVGAPPAPQLVSAELSKGWLALTPRPAPGARPARAARHAHHADELLARRDESFAQVQEHYYARPPQIERGWRHFLMSTAGRSYLDMVNNVTVLGHAHPRVAETAARQLRKLNTNSRFNYEAVVEFSERLAATAARSAGHRVPGELRFGGKRFGAASGDGGHRSSRRRRGARGVPRVDVCHRRRVHVGSRQPECACHPA